MNLWKRGLIVLGLGTGVAALSAGQAPQSMDAEGLLTAWGTYQ